MSSYKAVSFADPTLNPWNRTAKKTFRNISEHSQWVQYNNESERRRLNKRFALMDREHARQMRIMEADFQEVKNELRSLELQKRVVQEGGGRSRVSGRGIKRRGNTLNGSRGKNTPAPTRGRNAIQSDHAIQTRQHVPLEGRGVEEESSLPVIHRDEKPPRIVTKFSNSNLNKSKEVENRIIISNDQSSTSMPLLDQRHKMSITETIYYLSFQARQRFMDQAGAQARGKEKQGTNEDLGERESPGSAAVKSISAMNSVRTSAALWGKLRNDIKVDGYGQLHPTTSNRDALPTWKRGDVEERKVHTPCGRCDKCVQKLRTRRDHVMQQLYGQGRHIAERMERRRLVSGSAGWHALKSVVIFNNALKKTHQKEMISLPGS